MIKFLENKKVRIVIIAILVLILAGVVIGITLNKDKRDKTPAGQDVIVHEKDENAEEEIGEGGLIESDSEDGPVLKEENIIDYSGGDGGNKEDSDAGENSNKDDSGQNHTDKSDLDKDDSNQDNSDKDDIDKEGSDKDNSNKDDSNDENSNKDDSSKDEGTKDTGSWGAFY